MPNTRKIEVEIPEPKEETGACRAQCIVFPRCNFQKLRDGFFKPGPGCPWYTP